MDTNKLVYSINMTRDDTFHQKLIYHARESRRYPTPAEKKLWEHLRKKQLGGLKFRQQHIIDPYIVDFYCREKKLVIEVDGGTHLKKAFTKKIEKDISCLKDV